jgi:hypothetical protein
MDEQREGIMKHNTLSKFKRVNALISVSIFILLIVSCGKKGNQTTTGVNGVVAPGGAVPNYSINQKIDLILKTYRCPSGYRELSVLRFQGGNGQRIGNYAINGNNSTQVSIGVNYDFDVLVVNNRGSGVIDAHFYMCDNLSNGQNGNLFNRIIVNSAQFYEEMTTSSLNNNCTVNQVSSFAVDAQTSMGRLSLAFFPIDIVTSIPGVCEGNTGGYYPYHF